LDDQLKSAVLHYLDSEDIKAAIDRVQQTVCWWQSSFHCFHLRSALATGTRSRAIVHRQSLWLAGMGRQWAAGDRGLLQLCGNSKWRRRL